MPFLAIQPDVYDKSCHDVEHNSTLANDSHEFVHTDDRVRNKEETLPYIHACFREFLRLYPAASFGRVRIRNGDLPHVFSGANDVVKFIF